MAADAPSAAMHRLPPRIALVGLDDELADYLSAWLARHWPAARLQRRHAQQRCVADLRIVDREPDEPPCQPTLWLADIDRSAALMALGPCLWRTPMPTTARRLKLAIEACLRWTER